MNHEEVDNPAAASAERISAIEVGEPEETWLHHLWDAFWIGLALVIVSYAIYACIVLPVWSNFYRYPINPSYKFGQQTEDPSYFEFVSAQLALSQAYTGFVAIFLAGLLGVFALKEFNQAQSKPRLRLSFFDGGTGINDRQTVTLSPGHEAMPFQISAFNAGTSVAIWFQIQLHLSFLPEWALHQYQRKRNHAKRANDTSDAYFNVYEHLLSKRKQGEDRVHWHVMWDENEEEEKGIVYITFTSKGQFAAFPGSHLWLGNICVPSGHHVRPGTYPCEYVVVADRAGPYTGWLYLTIEPAPSAAPTV
jgi:hypothetical protein